MPPHPTPPHAELCHPHPPHPINPPPTPPPTNPIHSTPTHSPLNVLKLMAMLEMSRAVLFLGDDPSVWGGIEPAPSVRKALRKRHKDMKRRLRNGSSPSKPIRLSVNTQFDVTLAALRRHHGAECWVGPELEAVWRVMVLQGD